MRFTFKNETRLKRFLSCLTLTTFYIALYLQFVSNFRSYLAIVPQYVRPNSILSIPVTFLQPVGHETVTAILLEDENKTLAQDSVISNGRY